jgi:GNAT superfamily N-acetyltransferase
MTATENRAVPKIRFDYRPMELSEVDLERFRICFERNGSPRTAARVRWQYADNPTGKVFVDFAVDPARPSEIAGIYAVQPAMMRIGDHVRLGVQSVDTLVDEAYRGQGLFVKMARDVYARCEQAGAGLVYGFPNGNSAHGFFERLEWKPLDPVPFLVRPLRTRYVSDRLLRGRSWASLLPNLPVPVPHLRRPGARIEPLRRFDDRTDAIWREFARSASYAVERDARYLNWRLIDHWSGAYRCFAYYERDELLGFVSYVVYDKHGGRVAYVMEVMHEPWRRDVGRALLAHALRGARRDGADVALAWCLPHSPNRGVYAWSGFVTLPEKMWPIELHVGARGFAVPAAASLADRTRWYLSYCDSDTV